ncbi:MAG: hypothetical protein LBQ20_11325 [Rhodanobacter sp.]|nr:hypothetical protein [Rhodanobacter sp.]
MPTSITRWYGECRVCGGERREWARMLKEEVDGGDPMCHVASCNLSKP